MNEKAQSMINNRITFYVFRSESTAKLESVPREDSQITTQL